MTDRPKRWWLKWAAGAAVIVAGLAVIYAFNPSEGYRLYPPCVLHEVTGLDCPGCGTGRATYDLVHGRPLAALRHNPMLVLFVPILAFLVVDQLRRDLTGRPLPRIRWPWWVWAALPIVVIAFFVLRNVPGWPWDLLGP